MISMKLGIDRWRYGIKIVSINVILIRGNGYDIGVGRNDYQCGNGDNDNDDDDNEDDNNECVDV